MAAAKTSPVIAALIRELAGEAGVSERVWLARLKKGGA